MLHATYATCKPSFRLLFIGVYIRSARLQCHPVAIANMKSRSDSNEDTVPLLDDGLPSYDSATLPPSSQPSGFGSGQGAAGPSSLPGVGQAGSSTGWRNHGAGLNTPNEGAAGRPIPEYFFRGPGRHEAFAAEYPSLERLDIGVGKRGKGLWISDARLNDRTSLYCFDMVCKGKRTRSAGVHGGWRERQTVEIHS